MKSRYIPCSLVCLLLATPAWGQIPVTDAANLAQSLRQALTATQQLQQMYADYEQQIEQYEQQIKSHDSITGSYGVGELFADQGAQTYAPGTWQESLAMLRSGLSPAKAEDVKRFAQEAAQAYKFNRGEDLYPSQGQQAHALVQERQAQSSSAVLAISQTAFNSAGKRLERIERYLQQIDQATDLKAAVDLNNRLNLELVQALLEMNRLQAATMQLDAMNQVEGVRESQTNSNRFRFAGED